MSLLPRVLVGQKGAQVGLWVSKPGFNVQTAADDDMLLSPTAPNVAFLFKGRVSVTAANQERTVLFGTTLSEAPIIWGQVWKDDTTFIPSMQAYLSINAGGGSPKRYEIFPARTQFRFVNLKSVAYSFQYMVLQYPVAG